MKNSKNNEIKKQETYKIIKISNKNYQTKKISAGPREYSTGGYYGTISMKDILKIDKLL